MIVPSLSQGHLGCGEPVHSALPRRLFLLLANQRLTCAQNLLFVLVGRPGVLLGEKVEVRLADCLTGVGQASGVRPRLVGAEKTAPAVLEVVWSGMLSMSVCNRNRSWASAASARLLGDVAVVGDNPGDARLVQEVLPDGLDFPP